MVELLKKKKSTKTILNQVKIEARGGLGGKGENDRTVYHTHWL